MPMNIKGIYKDVLWQDGEIIYDPGWRSNRIVNDYGRFLAALMKKEFIKTDFEQTIGLEYMAFGSVNNGVDGFKDMIKRYFEQVLADPANTAPLVDNALNQWAWAKKLNHVSNMAYIDENDQAVFDQITSKLKIEVKLEKNEPSDQSLVLNEFSLIGIPKKSDGNIDPEHLFMVNYVNHGDITKVATMELSRTIHLNFPLE